MKTAALRGDLATLAKTKHKTWRGWAVYFWDMGHHVALFAKKPKREDPDVGGWDFTDAIEDIDPTLLTACGVDVPWDVMGDEGEDFYYGEEWWSGQHPPIRIELKLPEALLEQLRLL